MVRPYPDDFRLLLASSSPRRRELLASAGIPFEVVPTVADEDDVGADPRALAEGNAVRKARGARPPAPPPSGTFILGADTIVVVDSSILGKPRDVEDARLMLESLSGRGHEVITGVALLRVRSGGKDASLMTGACSTVVRFRTLDAAEIEAYVDSGEWHGKAGAYAIQGLASLFVQGIEGDHSNVVGLPLSLVADLLRDGGFDPVRRAWSL